MKASRRRWLLLLCLAAFATSPVLAQRGVGDAEGIVRQGLNPPVVTMQGTITDVKIGPCEQTTGHSPAGVHLLIEGEGQAINLHLGPVAAVQPWLGQLSKGQAVTFDAFRTDKLPENAYLAKTLRFGDQEVQLRDDALRPTWAAGQGQGRKAGGCKMRRAS
jgi:hypothetical protein